MRRKIKIGPFGAEYKYKKPDNGVSLKHEVNIFVIFETKGEMGFPVIDLYLDSIAEAVYEATKAEIEGYCETITDNIFKEIDVAVDTKFDEWERSDSSLQCVEAHVKTELEDMGHIDATTIFITER